LTGGDSVSFPRLLEDAADEVARLDLHCSREVPAITLAAWLTTVSASVDQERSSIEPLVAAAADPIHDPSLPPRILAVRSFLAAEERRARSGAPFALARWEAFAPGLATYPNRDRLEAEWKANARDRPALERAIAAGAWLDDPVFSSAETDLSSLAITLLLCATGRTAHARFLPLLDIDGEARASASAAFRTGETTPWKLLSLETVARAARARREALGRLGPARERDERALSTLGRAGITARRVLEHLHSVLATTMPATAEALDLSRPAAAAALDRLVSVGVAREVTGRARDRVYAWSAPLDLLARRPAA
jgi:hypothetical protein